MSADISLALRNLAAWSVQVGVLGLAAAVLSRLLPVDRPAPRLAFGQALLVVVLGLPLVQPWQSASAVVSWSLATSAPGAAGSAGARGLAAGAPLWPVLVADVLLVGAALRLVRLTAGLARLRSLGRAGRPLEPPP